MYASKYVKIVFFTLLKVFQIIFERHFNIDHIILCILKGFIMYYKQLNAIPLASLIQVEHILHFLDFLNISKQLSWLHILSEHFLRYIENVLFSLFVLPFFGKSRPEQELGTSWFR